MERENNERKKRVSFASEDTVKYIYDSDSSKSKSNSIGCIEELSLDLTLDTTINAREFFKKIQLENKNKEKINDYNDNITDNGIDNSMNNNSIIDNNLNNNCINSNFFKHDLHELISNDENKDLFNKNEKENINNKEELNKEELNKNRRSSLNRGGLNKNRRNSLGRNRRNSINKEELINIGELNEEKINKEKLSKNRRNSLSKNRRNSINEEELNEEELNREELNNNEEEKNNKHENSLENESLIKERISIGEDTFIEPLQVDEIIDTIDLKKIIPVEKKTVSELLIEQGIRFMDNLMCKKKRDTISKMRSKKEPEKEEYYKYLQSRIDFFNEFVNVIETKIGELQGSIDEMEAEIVNINHRNLKELKLESRQRSKIAWYQLRKEREILYYEKIFEDKKNLLEKIQKLKIENKNLEEEFENKNKKSEGLKNIIKGCKQNQMENIENSYIKQLVKELINKEDNKNINLENEENTENLSIINDQKIIIENLKNELEQKKRQIEAKGNKRKILLNEIETTEKDVERIKETLSQNIDENQLKNIKKHYNFLKNILKINPIKINKDQFEYEICECKFKITENIKINLNTIYLELESFFINSLESYKTELKKNYTYEENYKIKNQEILKLSKKEKINLLIKNAIKLHLLQQQIKFIHKNSNLNIKFENNLLRIDIEIIDLECNKNFIVFVDYEFNMKIENNCIDFLWEIFVL